METYSFISLRELIEAKCDRRLSLFIALETMGGGSCVRCQTPYQRERREFERALRALDSELRDALHLLQTLRCCGHTPSPPPVGSFESTHTPRRLPMRWSQATQDRIVDYLREHGPQASHQLQTGFPDLSEHTIHGLPAALWAARRLVRRKIRVPGRRRAVFFYALTDDALKQFEQSVATPVADGV